MSPAEQEARDMIADKKARAAATKAYDAADKTPPAPAVSPKPDASAPKPKRMASGGTASARADGIASRGKTRGKMC
jgi:hypothetical protein